MELRRSVAMAVCVRPSTLHKSTWRKLIMFDINAIKQGMKFSSKRDHKIMHLAKTMLFVAKQKEHENTWLN